MSTWRLQHRFKGFVTRLAWCWVNTSSGLDGLKRNPTLTWSSFVSSVIESFIWQTTVNRPSVKQEVTWTWTRYVGLWLLKDLKTICLNYNLCSRSVVYFSWTLPELVLTDGSIGSVRDPTPSPTSISDQIRRFSGSFNVCTELQFSDGIVSRDIRCLRVCVKRFYWKMSQCSAWEEIWNWRGTYVRWWMPSTYTQHYFLVGAKRAARADRDPVSASVRRANLSRLWKRSDSPAFCQSSMFGVSLCDAASLCKQKQDCAVLFSLPTEELNSTVATERIDSLLLNMSIL